MADNPMTTLDRTDLYRQEPRPRAAQERRAVAAQPTASLRAGAPCYAGFTASPADWLRDWRLDVRRTLSFRRGALT